MSIRQRRRNRHRLRELQSHAKHPITLVLNIDATKINAIFAKTRDAIRSLVCIKEILGKAFEEFVLINPHIIREFISVGQTRFVPQEVEVDYLGDPSCKFNARSPYLQCAVNPSGNCATCCHFESCFMTKAEIGVGR